MASNLLPFTQTSRRGIRNVVPGPEAGAAECRDFFERWCNFRSTYRNRHMARMARNLHYLYGRQWIELDTEVLLETARGFAFRDIRGGGYDGLPRPVTNYIDPAVETEIAALGKKEYKPNVIATSNHPKVIAAARLAKQILEYRMDQLGWPDLRDLFTLILVATGTGIMRSFWDRRVSQPSLILAPDSMSCASCGTVVSSPRIPRDVLQMQDVFNTDTIREVPREPDSIEEVDLQHCPGCNSRDPLEPFEATPEEVEGTQDFFGRDLGLYAPLGEDGLEVHTPFEIFPQNGGVGITPQNMTSYAIAMPRSLEWLEDRHPDRIDEIAPESPAELMRYHPILGEWDLIGRYQSMLDSGVYDDHVMWYSFYQEPTAKHPDGRVIEMAGDVLLDNTAALIPFKDHLGRTRKVRSARLSAARYKIRVGEFWGAALPDNGISPQNRMNGMDAQIIEARDRMGSPNLLVPDDLDFRGPEWFDEYGSGKIMRYTPDPSSPEAKPEVFGSVLFPGGVWQERDRCLQDFQTILGPQEIEVGDVPKGLKTTSGLVLLGENANRKRGPRERAMATVYEEQWATHLQHLYALRTEPQPFEVDVFEGFSRREMHYFKGTDLLGQTQVKVSKEAAVDKGIYQREAAVEAQQDGLYLITDAASRKRLLELRGLPTDVNEDQNLQVQGAEQQWVDYKDQGLVPVIDVDIDDFGIHYRRLATLLLTDEGKELEAAVGWMDPEVIKKLAGWERILDEQEMKDTAARMVYGNEAALDPMLAQQKFAEANAQFSQASAAYADQSKGAQVAAAPGLAPAMPPPQAPPPLFFLPDAMEDKVYLVWLKLLAAIMAPTPIINQETGAQEIDPTTGQPLNAPVSEEIQTFDTHLRFRSVVAGYKRLAAQQLQKAAMQATMAAPQGGATPSGTVAAPGMPMVPGGGSGPDPMAPGPNA